MDANLEFYMKLGLTLLFSIIIFVGMMILQRRKEAQAQLKFEEFLRSKGINPELQETLMKKLKKCLAQVLKYLKNGFALLSNSKPLKKKSSKKKSKR